MSKKSKQPPEAVFLGMPKKLTSLLNNESDRGAILILAAYLEEILSFIVQGFCISQKYGEKIVELKKPAGDFDSKILLCSAFGLIHVDEERSLRLVQKIRNRAAHFDKKGRGFDVLFDSDQTVDQIAELLKINNFSLSSRDAKEARNGFITCCRLLGTKLYLRLASVSRMPTPLSHRESADAIIDKNKKTPLGELMQELRTSAEKGDPERLNEVLEIMDKFLEKLENTPDKSK